MRNKAFLDSNVFIFGFELPRSNSRRILELLASGEIRGVVTDRIVREVTGYFRREHGKDQAVRGRDFILITCEPVLEADLTIPHAIATLVGRKDAGALAATRGLGLSRLVSLDRDFVEVPECRTPREYLSEIGQRPRAGQE